VIRKILKFTLLILVIIILLGFLAYTYFDQLFTRFKPHVERLLSTATECQVNYNSTSITFQPQFKFVLSGLSVKQCKKANLEIKNADLIIDFRTHSLIEDHYDILGIDINKAVVIMNGTASKNDNQTPADDGEAAESLFHIRSLKISNSSLKYSNAGSEIRLGKLNGDFEVLYKDSKQPALNGDVELSDLSSTEPFLKLKLLKFTNLNLSRDEEGRIKIDSGASLQGLNIETLEKEKYQTARATGKFSTEIDSESAVKFKGNFDVKGFGFSDDTVDLNQVDAVLKNITGNVDKNQNSLFTVDLDGNKLKLATDDFWVKSISSVKAPLKISIPAKGGYSVSGPVDIKNSSLKASDKELENTEGTIDMLITGPSKRFKSANLSTDLNKENAKVSCDFEMKKSLYQLHSFTAEAFGGITNATFAMGRKENNQLSSKIMLENVMLERVLNGMEVTHPPDLSVKVLTLSADLKSEKANMKNTFEGQGDIKAAQGEATGELTFQAKKGVIETHDLYFDVPRKKILAEGTYSFAAGLDFKGKVVLFEDTARSLAGPIKPLGWLLGKLAKVQLPFTVKGSPSDPKASIDGKEILSITSPSRLLSGIFDAVERIF
jgi:hypothetical protein